MPHDTRDSVVDFVAKWSRETEIAPTQFAAWLGIHRKLYAWRHRYGKANEHNAKIPRDHWLDDWERNAIIDFHHRYPLEGYRRLTFMMLDEDVVAVSPSTTYRILKAAGLLDRWNRKPSKKGTGFVQPDGPHRHWHIDVAYINIAGTFYYLCAILDGYSRFLVHWEIREQMTERDIETILQRAVERFPDVKPRIISDNGPQFIARDFKSYIRIVGMTHVRTSPFYPQSNGKVERFNKTWKNGTVRVTPPESLEEARELVAAFVEHYNTKRLHSAIGYVTPLDKLEGREREIWAARDEKLERARKRRRDRRQVGHDPTIPAAGRSPSRLSQRQSRSSGSCHPKGGRLPAKSRSDLTLADAEANSVSTSKTQSRSR